ncbi:MAG: HD domain-containing protein [Candidatus Bathyarchaeia archaeon]
MAIEISQRNRNKEGADLKRAGEIKDPVHGYIYFTEVEKDIIDSSPFQRLHRIKQLAGAELTYPGAIHTRFLHSIGTMHLSGALASHLYDLGYLTSDEVQKIRIAGLLHDIGHGPFSHVYEEILDKYRHITHEDLSRWVIRESEIGDILGKHGFSKEEIADLAVGVLAKTEKNFLNQLVAGHFSPDIMDYLLRDSYYAGVGYGRVDVHRLINSLDLVDNVIAADYSGAFGVLESFIMARIEMFNVVYFHRTVRAANVMISRAMDYANERLGLCAFKNVDDFLDLDDAGTFLAILSLKNATEKKLATAYDMAERVRSRRLLKSTFEVTVHRRDTFFSNLLNRASIREQLEVELADKAGVEPEYLVIDVPTVLSIPINPIERRRSDILVYKKRAGVKVAQRITEISPLMASLAEFVDIIRVYAKPQDRESVTKVCEQVFGNEPPFRRISM